MARNLAMALAIVALVLAAAVEAKARDKKDDKKLTSPPSKTRTHQKPPPAAKAAPQHAKAPASSLPDLTTISKPGKPKHGAGTKQHTVVSYGPTPAKPSARKAPARNPKTARKDRTQLHQKTTTAKPKGVNKSKGIPTIYRGKNGQVSERPPKVNRKPTVHTNQPKQPAHVRKQQAKAEKLMQHTATVRNIMNNPTKHKGITVNTYKGAPHPETSNKRIRAETAQAKAAAAAVPNQPKNFPAGRKKPSAMTASMMADEKRKADMKRAAKELKRQKETAKKAAPEDMRKAAQEHLRKKQAADQKGAAADAKGKQ